MIVIRSINHSINFNLHCRKLIYVIYKPSQNSPTGHVVVYKEESWAYYNIDERSDIASKSQTTVQLMQNR